MSLIMEDMLNQFAYDMLDDLLPAPGPKDDGLFTLELMDKLKRFQENLDPDLKHVDFSNWNSLKAEISNILEIFHTFESTESTIVAEALWRLVTISRKLTDKAYNSVDTDTFVEFLLVNKFLETVSKVLESSTPISDILMYYPLMRALTHLTPFRSFSSKFAVQCLAQMLNFFDLDCVRVADLNVTAERLDTEILVSTAVSFMVVFAHALESYPAGKELFRSLGGDKRVEEYLESEMMDLRLASLLVLAISSDGDDQHSSEAFETSENTLRYMVAHMEDAIKSPHDVPPFSTDFNSHGTAAVKVIALLARNESNSQKLVALSGLLDSLCGLLERNPCGEEMFLAVLDALWTFCFVDDNVAVMKNHAELMSSIEKMTTHKDEKLAMMSKNIMWEMKKETRKVKAASASKTVKIAEKYPRKSPRKAHSSSPPSPPSPPPVASSDDSPRAPPPPTYQESEESEYLESQPNHVMISYSWAQQPVALKLRDSLRRQGLKVWIDVEQMKGFLSERMAEAVENAFAVIICISESYRVSNACKSEANYSFELGKTLVPVIAEEDFFPTGGWLRLIIAGRLYYKVSSDELFRENYPKMAEYVRSLGPGMDDENPSPPLLPENNEEKKTDTEPPKSSSVTGDVMLKDRGESRGKDEKNVEETTLTQQPSSILKNQSDSTQGKPNPPIGKESPRPCCSCSVM